MWRLYDFVIVIHWEHCLEQSLCCFETGNFPILVGNVSHTLHRIPTRTQRLVTCCYENENKSYTSKNQGNVHLHFICWNNLPTINKQTQKLPSEYQMLTNQSDHPFVLQEKEVKWREYLKCSLQHHTFSGEDDWVHILWKIRRSRTNNSLFPTKVNVWYIYSQF